MFFVSTRNSKVISNFKTAILQPMAPDGGGLYTPSFITQLKFNEIEKFEKMKYADILVELLQQFCIDEFTRDELSNFAHSAFDGFNSKEDNGAISMQELEEDTFMLNLTHGPSGNMKDYGYGFASAVVNDLAKKEGKIRGVIDISHGNSGPSTAFALQGKEYLKGFILEQLTDNKDVKGLISKAMNLKEIFKPVEDNEKKGFGAPPAEEKKDAKDEIKLNYIKNGNVAMSVVEEKTTFFENLIYEVENNVSLRDLENLTYINENNLCNILAYLPAFFLAYLRCHAKPFCVSVPTSNGSLAIAAFYAKKMGLPIKKIILGVEKNFFFHEMQETKLLLNDKDPDVGQTSLCSRLPSNFERILFYLYEANQGSVNRSMSEIKTNQRYKINDDMQKKFAEDFFVAQCDNQYSIRNTVFTTIREKDIRVEQHFAIASMAAEQASSSLGVEVSNYPMVIFNTQDYKRNIDFVNATLGFDLDNIDFSWTDEDLNAYQPVLLTSDKNVILRAIVDGLDAIK